MSGGARIAVVFRKELLDILRDRRTLTAMVLIPVVLYPVLMVAGYSNSPESFELAAADLDILLGQITVQGVSGLIKRGQPEAATAGTDERSEPTEESPGVEENEDDGRPEEGQEPSEASGSENDNPKDAVTPSPLVLDEE